MGQANKQHFERTRLEPQFERRQVGWTMDRETGLPKPETAIFIIGHGQQLAARRLHAILASHRATDNMVTRQQKRRHYLKLDKQAARTLRDKQASDELKAIRAGRKPHHAIKQGPGNLAPIGRAYKKPHGRPGWRLIDQEYMPDGSRVPEGYDATFHTTKGLRVVRVPA